MRSNVPAIFLFVLATIFTTTSFAEGKSEVSTIEGEWTVVSKKHDGKLMHGRPKSKYYEDTGGFWENFSNTGETFSLYGNGRGSFYDEVLYWNYDKSKGTFTIQRKAAFTFGWVDEVDDASAHRDGDTIVLDYSRKYSDGTKFKVELIIVPKHLAPLIGATVVMEPKTFDQDFFTEEYETSPGVPKKITLKRDFETSITTTQTVGAEEGTQATIGSDTIAAISNSLKQKIETSLGTTIGTRETFEEGYELDGKEHLKLNIRWVKRFRKGMITLKNGEKRAFEAFIGYRTIPDYTK